MKLLKYIMAPVAFMLFVSLILTSCSEDGNGLELDSPDGPPSIDYIRITNPTKSDSLIVEASLGQTIALVGKNLGGTRKIFFNDQQAILQPVWVTNRVVIVDVPNIAPLDITDMLYVIDSKEDTIEIPFKVKIPPPVLDAVVNEWPQDGENLVIQGNYFFEPLTVSFTGGGMGEIVSVSQSELIVTVPDDASEGPITVETGFGETESTFHLWDTRNIVLDFDSKKGNGWRIGLIEGSDNPIDGNYLVIRGEIDANQRNEGPDAPNESPFAMQYWGGNDPNRSENFYPLYPNSYQDYVLKFEAKVKKWYGGYLNICLASPEHPNVLPPGKVGNYEIWSNDANARAIWAPWVEDGEEYNSDDKWITVVVPMTDFQYSMGANDDGVYYTPGQPFIETAAGSLSTWFLGSPENSGNEVEFYIDNIRFVKP